MAVSLQSSRRSRRAARKLARELGLPSGVLMELMTEWAQQAEFQEWLAAGGRKSQAPAFVLADIAAAQRRDGSHPYQANTATEETT